MAQVPLELQFCDGGRYDGDRYYYYTSTEYCPENALHNDSSGSTPGGYCTGDGRMNTNLISQFTVQKTPAVI